jgi:diguanylate cyclase (GGDEF)-like protein
MTKKLPILGSDGEPQYLLTLSEDVTERKRAEARIAHMAHHDALTGLPNRAAFSERLSGTLDRQAAAGENCALLCLDLDRFKEVNDVFGHSVGDALLQEVSRRMQRCAGGAFLARLGGDEFTFIVADGAQPSTAAALGDRLLAEVAGDIEIDSHRLRIGISIGVGIFPSDGADPATLLANADAALYRAKADGRGVIRFFEAEMDTRLRERRVLQQELRSAYQRNEFFLDYQPQAEIGGEVVGFEALLRWRSPSRGVVPPGIFIPLAEESGLIIPMGERILREACREAASWPKPLQIAVNLSPIQFRHGDLPTMVHSALLESGLNPSRLELEITEGTLIDDISRALSILRRLKSLGVRIAMDDFGTGYSSLSYLQSFPFDKIKIDRTFISKLNQSPQSASIVRAVIGLGRGLALPVVAEGVETEDQLAFLAREACNEVQGYLIGRPSSIDDYGEFVGRPNAPSSGVTAVRR